MIGYVDFAQPDIVSGWAFDSENPASTVVLEILVDDGVVGRAVANRMRPDVRRAGFGDGRCGFMFEFVTKLAPTRRHTVAVRVADSGEPLNNSPCDIPPVYDVGDRTIDGFNRAIEGAATGDDRERVLQALVAAADHLRAMRDSRNQPGSRLRGSGLPLALVLGPRVPEAGALEAREVASLVRLGFRVVFVADEDPGTGGGEALDLPHVEIARRDEFGTVEDVLAHFGNETALVHLVGRDVALRYAGLVRAHCGVARMIYDAPDADPALPSRVAASWANIILARSAEDATALRALLAGRDVRIREPASSPKELDRILGGVVGSSKAPRLARKTAV